MFPLFLLLAPFLCDGLRIRAKGWGDAQSVWCRPFSWSRLETLLGSLDISRSGHWLVELLGSSEYPIRDIYLSAYASGKFNLSWSRLEETVHFQATNGYGIEQLLPLQMLAGAMIRWKSSAVDLSRLHPSMALQSPSLHGQLGRNGEPGIMSLPKGVIPRELAKVFRAPLRDMVGCGWAFNAFASAGMSYLDMVDNGQHPDWILERIHPVCIQEALEGGTGPFSAVLQPLLGTRMYKHPRSIDGRWMRLAIRLGLVQLMTFRPILGGKTTFKDVRRENYRSTVDAKLAFLADSIKSEIGLRRQEDSASLRLALNLIGAIHDRLVEMKLGGLESDGQLDSTLKAILQVATHHISDEAWKIHWTIATGRLLVLLGASQKTVLDELALILESYDLSLAWPLDLQMLQEAMEGRRSDDSINALHQLLLGARINGAYGQMVLAKVLRHAIERDDVPGIFQAADLVPIYDLVRVVPLERRLAFLRRQFGNFEPTSSIAVFIGWASQQLGLPCPRSDFGWSPRTLLAGLFTNLKARGLIGVRGVSRYSEILLLIRNDMKILGFGLGMAILYGQKVPLEAPLHPAQLELIVGRGPEQTKTLDALSLRFSGVANYGLAEATRRIQAATTVFLGVLPLAEILSLDELIQLLS